MVQPIDETRVLPVEPGAEIGEETAPERPPALGKRLLDPKTILSFVFAAAILVFVLSRADVDFSAILGNIRRADASLFAVALIAYYLSFYVRALRWRQLLTNVGFSRELHPSLPRVAGLVEIVLLSWFVNCLVPAKLGDAYRSYLLKQRAGVSFSRTIGTILAERIIDLLVLFGLLSVSGIVAFHGRIPDSASPVFLLGLGFVIAILVGLAAMRMLGSYIVRLIPLRFRPMYERFEHGTLTSFRRRTIPVLLVYTGLVWLLEGTRLFFVARSLDVHVGLSVVVFIALASSLLTTIPFTPAGLGAVESAIILVFMWIGVDKNLAASVGVLDRVISYWSLIVVGFVIYLVSRRR